MRHQLCVLKRSVNPSKLTATDRVLWIALRRFWPRWKQVLVIVNPDTVVGWHRTTFRWYWRWRSRRRPGRPRIGEELRTLTRRLAQENPGWEAPKIHGQLLKLGLIVCERTVARYLRVVGRGGAPGRIG